MINDIKWYFLNVIIYHLFKRWQSLQENFAKFESQLSHKLFFKKSWNTAKSCWMFHKIFKNRKVYFDRIIHKLCNTARGNGFSDLLLSRFKLKGFVRFCITKREGIKKCFPTFMIHILWTIPYVEVEYSLWSKENKAWIITCWIGKRLKKK
jgi:hypothetical protein